MVGAALSVASVPTRPSVNSWNSKIVSGPAERASNWRAHWGPYTSPWTEHGQRLERGLWSRQKKYPEYKWDVADSSLQFSVALHSGNERGVGKKNSKKNPARESCKSVRIFLVPTANRTNPTKNSRPNESRLRVSLLQLARSQAPERLSLSNPGSCFRVVRRSFPLASRWAENWMKGLYFSVPLAQWEGV